LLFTKNQPTIATFVELTFANLFSYSKLKGENANNVNVNSNIRYHKNEDNWDEKIL